MNSQVKSWYEKQKNGQWKTLTAPLTQDTKLHNQLNNFTKTIYQKFCQQKNLPLDFKPTIKFQGFQGFQDFPQEETKMGHCDSKLKTNWQQTLNGQKIEGSETYSGSLSIVLSQKLLLSKLGMPELIINYQENSQGANWKSLPVSFKDLIDTIAHEIAHAYQLLVNEDEVKSQCESTGKRDSKGQLKYPQLAYEHTTLTEEIRVMTVKLTEYQKFKNWWEGKEVPENLLEDKNETVAKTLQVSPKPTIRVEKADENLEKELINQDQNWPSWVLPLGIVVGVVLLGGLLYWVFKPKK